MPTRRSFVTSAAAGLAGLGAVPTARAAAQASAAPALVRPPRLKPGDTVGLVNPAGATWSTIDIDIVRESFEALELKVKAGAHVLDRHGYFAGRDEDRAADVNAMFADPVVKGIICIKPEAPFSLSAWGINPDSCFMTARISHQSNPYFLAWSR